MPSRPRIFLAVLTRTVVSLVLLAVALAVLMLLVRTRPLPEISSKPPAAPTVKVLAVQQVPVQRQWIGYGTARAMDAASVPARVSATVVEIPDGIEAGAEVRRGQLLVRLDDSDFQRQVEISTQSIADIAAQLSFLRIEGESWKERVQLATEEVTLSESEYDRAKVARERGAANEREVDQARSSLIQAIRTEVAAKEELEKIPPRISALEAQKLGQESSLKLAEQNVTRCRIVSPLDGVLQSGDVDVGENLAVGQHVGRVVNLDRVEVPLRLPAGARASVLPGDSVLLRSAGSAGTTWDATITRIAPEDDEATRTMTVYVEVARDAGSRGAIAPGMFIVGRVTSSDREPRWIVPRRALKGDRVRLVRDGTLTSREVDVDFHLERSFPELGIPDTQWVVLLDGLQKGDHVLVNAARSLPEGALVQGVPVGDAVATGGQTPSATGTPGASP